MSNSGWAQENETAGIKKYSKAQRSRTLNLFNPFTWNWGWFSQDDQLDSAHDELQEAERLYRQEQRARSKTPDFLFPPSSTPRHRSKSPGPERARQLAKEAETQPSIWNWGWGFTGLGWDEEDQTERDYFEDRMSNSSRPRSRTLRQKDKRKTKKKVADSTAFNWSWNWGGGDQEEEEGSIRSTEDVEEYHKQVSFNEAGSRRSEVSPEQQHRALRTRSPTVKSQKVSEMMLKKEQERKLREEEKVNRKLPKDYEEDIEEEEYRQNTGEAGST